MQTRHLHHRLTRQRGQALISTVVAISLVILILLATITFTQFSNKAIARQLTYQGQALNAAQAGITETLSWFRQQNILVTAFSPKQDLAANPQINETECPSVNAAAGCPRAGIVRTFDVSQAGNLKGRYEAVIGTAGGTTGVVDVTNMVKNGANAGTVWQLESTGYVWVNNDPTKNFNQAPNTIISQQTVRTQIQRMTVTLPQGGAALFIGKPWKAAGAVIGAKTKLKGGTSLGLAYAGTTAPSVSGTVTGTPGGGTYANSVAPYDIKSVFNVTQAELLNLADVQYSKMSDVPNPLPAMSLVIYNGNAAFTQAKPLSGSGIFVVFGDLSITGVTNSNYNGVIYVTGSLTIDNPASISGAVVTNANSAATSTITLGNTSNDDILEIDYDPSIISQLNAQMGQYRFTRNMYWVGK